MNCIALRTCCAALLVLLTLSGCKSLTYEQGYLNGNVKYPQSAE